jgi:hypothetical protein
VIESYDFEKAFRTQCEALRLRASSEMALLQHKVALVTLKFLLESAFRSRDQVSEIFVYEKMALCHFYLGELERAKYYLAKMMRGLNEPENSEILMIYKNLRLNYQIAKNGGKEIHLILETKAGHVDIFDTFY